MVFRAQSSTLKSMRGRSQHPNFSPNISGHRPGCAFCVFARSSIDYYVPAKVQSTATTNILPGPVAFSKCRGESDVSIELRFPDQST